MSVERLSIEGLRTLYSLDCHLAACWDLLDEPAESERAWLQAEATSIRLDMATAERIVGRRTDAATLARREGVGWG